MASDGTVWHELPSKYRKLLTKDFLADIIQKKFPETNETASEWSCLEGIFGWYYAPCAAVESVEEDKEKYAEMLAYYQDLPWYDSDLSDNELTIAAVKMG